MYIPKSLQSSSSFSSFTTSQYMMKIAPRTTSKIQFASSSSKFMSLKSMKKGSDFRTGMAVSSIFGGVNGRLEVDAPSRSAYSPFTMLLLAWGASSDMNSSVSTYFLASSLSTYCSSFFIGFLASSSAVFFCSRRWYSVAAFSWSIRSYSAAAFSFSRRSYSSCALSALF